MAKRPVVPLRGAAPPTMADAPYRQPRAERLAAGRKLRRRFARSALAALAPDKRDPIALLGHSNRARLQHLVPMRYARMLHSPFAFLRGAAAVMAHDLGQSGHSGIRTQLCGDCHLNNFGGYASPERELLFGINDFDETLPGPFEWDVKRLAASFVVAARVQGIAERHCFAAAAAVAASYRSRMDEYAHMRALDLWYVKVDFATLVKLSRNPATRRRREALVRSAKRHDSAVDFAKLVEKTRKGFRFIDQPPLIYHPPANSGMRAEVEHFWQHYAETLPEERRRLLDHYRLVDVAIKVVGVGSVGTRCAIALLMADDDDPLILQFKEAGPSVLEPWAGASRYANHGLRVIVGQRLMQSFSDIFLGFSRVEALNADFYVRQLRDMKVALDFEEMRAEEFIEYAEACGWALARAHAKAGDPALIAGYLGRSEVFAQAISRFARAYADRTEADHAALVKAVKSGRIQARLDAAP